MECLNEVYFGKKPIMPLQKQLSVFRKKLANKPVSSSTNIDSTIIKFDRLAESIFGFKNFALYIQPNHLPNAYAFPVDLYADSEKEKMEIYQSLVANPTGFNYSDAFTDVSLIIAIHSGLLDDKLYTDAELMAVLLHEIGHGFFSAVVDENCRYSKTRYMIEILSNVLKFAKDKVNRGKIFIPGIADEEISLLTSSLSFVKDKILGIKRLFGESMDQNLRSSRYSYTNEKFADSFAAMYGYAEESQAVLMKMNNDFSEKKYGKQQYPRIIEALLVFDLSFWDHIAYFLGLQDEHPQQLARTKTTIEYLKREVSKDSIDPKMKKQIMEDIQKAEKLIEDYINFPKDEDSMRILRLYHIKLYEKCGGDLRERDTDNEALFDTVDERYKRLRGLK